MTDKPDGRRRPISDADVAKMRDMRAGGASDREIGLAFGIGPRAANKRCRRANVPSGLGKCPGNDREKAWTEAERAIVIAAGYDFTVAGLMQRLPGRTDRSIHAMRVRLTKKKLITKPDSIAGHSRAMRSKRALIERAPTPPRVKASAPKPPQAGKSKPRPIHVKPTINPPRAIVAPLPPEPAPRVLPPGTEILIRRPWPVIKQMALGIGVIMTGMHDLDRFNRRRAELKMPPVYITWQGGKG